MSAVHVLDLTDERALRLADVGGKAANLTELIRGGFPVPGGFVVRTSAYAIVAKSADIAAIDAAGAELAAQARAALLNAEVPADIVKELTDAYTALGPDVPVAVRSSATAEDLPDASFAGQQDTYLEITGTDAVLDAVQRCWASLWTDRAVSYRDANGIPHSEVQLAVVVQRMIDAVSAGVLFTADPIAGTRTHSVIDVAPGLGEAVVSGAVNPDHAVVAGNDVTYTVGERADGARCLSDEQARELAELGRRAESHFGSPQDIEWAVDDGGRLWLTQSRPITTLYPVPSSGRPGLRVYFNITLAQGLTRPITPMGLAAFRALGATAARDAFGIPVKDQLAGPPALVDEGGRAFIDVTAAVRNPLGRKIVPRLLDVMEARSAAVIRSLFADPRLSIQGSHHSALRRIVRALVHFRIPWRIGQALVSPRAARRRVARVWEQYSQLTDVPTGTHGAALLDHVEDVLARTVPVMPAVASVPGSGFIALGLARKLAGDDLNAAAVNEVLRSLPHNVTTEMDLELWDLAQRVRADEASAAALRDRAPAELAEAPNALPTMLRDGLDEFLSRHGHRAVAEIDIGMPRWSEDPTHVLGALANYLRLTDPDAAPDAVFSRGAGAATAAVERIVSIVRRRSKWRAKLLAFALGRVRQLAGVRETHKDYLIRLIAHARAQLRLIGGELAQRGLLDDAADVFFLDLREVRSALDGADHRPAIAERRVRYERELRRRHIPRILLSDGTEPEAIAGVAAASPGSLVGSPASAGTVTAPARVVLDPHGAHLEPGEILVAPSTDPGWTPLFLTAGGLVMEMGGPMSHGAVVAREYGIPAVVGVSGATTEIATGDMVTVDGAKGTVSRSVG
jgi:pyruvate,water dikinase